MSPSLCLLLKYNLAISISHSHLPLCQIQNPSPDFKNLSQACFASMESHIHIEPENQPPPGSTDLLLDLSLSMNNDDEVLHRGSSSNSNSDIRYHGDADTDVDHNQGQQSPHHHNPRVFSCNYCQRKFYSSQALGGHQNAHKRERTLAKRHRIVGDTGLGRCSSMASLPLHGYRTFNRNSLGIHVHSMIHNPTLSYMSSSVGNEYGHGYSHGHRGDGLHRLPLHQRPNVGRLGGQGSTSGIGNGNSVAGVGYSVISPSSTTCSNHGVARFEGVRKFSPAADGIDGGLWWGGGVSSQLKSKQEELQNIDLSLKL